MTFQEFSNERDKIRSIGNEAVRKAQEENRDYDREKVSIPAKKTIPGIPNVYSTNGQIYYQLPDGKITIENPFKGRQFLLEAGFHYLFSRDLYIHKTKRIVIPGVFADDFPDFPDTLEEKPKKTEQGITFYDDIPEALKKEIIDQYFT